MSNFPDFSQLGYQVIRELGRNREAGRITYLATALNQDQQVVIKEFRFADSGADWSGFKAYQREIEVLQQLSHPRIPRYLDSFETPQGFCLVQEYKNALSLAVRHSFNPEDIKQIALSVLEILVYLQKRTPPVIHRDIKPENILVDKRGHEGTARTAYLVDFGLARIRGGEVALSSVAAGTPGFMPPEEQFGRPLTEASDLYSLGATLICLLTGTRSVDIGKLIDDNYRFNFKKLVPQLSPRFVEWLTKLIEPNLKNRYANAAVALEALKPIQVKGNATLLETLVGAIKLRMPATVLGLLTIVTLLGTSFINYQQTQSRYQQAQSNYQQVQSHYQQVQSSFVRQLLTTGECQWCDFQKAELKGARLKYAKLEGANLKLADLEGASLEGAILKNAILEDAILKDANLEGANLAGAYSAGANLYDANLKGANLKDAILTGANLYDANLEGAYLESARLWGANLRYTNLTGANLKGAYLGSANLQEANLQDANLTGAQLKSANLQEANLQDADLRDADLRGADLRGAYLGNSQLQGATMPDGTTHK